MAFRSMADEFVLFNRELSALVRTRLPLPEGIRRIGRQMRSRSFRKALARVEEDLREGMSLSDAMARHRQHFSPYYIQAVRAGEESGDLLSVLDHLSGYLSALERMKQRLRGASAYPAITFVVFLLVLGAVLGYIVPYFIQYWGEAGALLPAPTRILVFFSEMFGFHPLAPLFLVLGVLLLLRVLLLLPGIREGWGITLLFLPMIGRISRRMDLARFSLGMGHLLSSRVPLPDALRLSAGTLRNGYARAVARDLARQVREGRSLGESMESAYFFPDFYYWAIGEGERREDLAQTFLDLGDHYQRWAEERLSNLAYLMEPFLLLFMGGIVVFVAIGLYMPMFRIGSIISM
jgi:type II secretory pathway component PulF